MFIDDKVNRHKILQTYFLNHKTDSLIDFVIIKCLSNFLFYTVYSFDE